MEVRVADCPLGAKCEEVKEFEGRQVLFRCPWYTQLRGGAVQDQEEWACAIAWMPILQIENAKETRQGAKATESFRNEMVREQQGIRTAEDVRDLLEGPRGQ